MSSPYFIDESRRAYDGQFLSVREDSVSLESGHSFTYELVEHPGGAAILPIDAAGNCYLVKQYRHPVEQDVLEIPAGRLENDGSSPSDNAIRECQEEVGFCPKSVTPLGYVLPSPGVVQERIHLFLGQDLEPTDAQPDPGEILEVVVLPFDVLLKMVLDGRITDAKTALATIRAAPLIQKQS